MKLIIILIVAFSFSASSNTFSQQVSLSVKQANLENVMQEVRKQSGYAFIFNSVDLKQSKAVTAELRGATIELTLNTIFEGQPFTYEIKESTIIVKLREKSIFEKLTKFLTPPIDIKGKVVDSLGRPLVGASIKVKGLKLSTSTDHNGEFTLNGVDGNRLLVISYLGHVSRELKPMADMGNIVLTVANLELEEVKINTGMFSRNKETFTGVTRTISGKELRAASRQNILEGLNMLDPSFKIIRDNNFGSDPNQLPKVEMRGNRSLIPPTEKKYSQQLKLQYEQDPNQPLFILDGFETSLTTIVNLDVNRIASVTLLKDAASTALYGSRSANGVVVVETIRPTPGELRVSYGASINFSMPDLTGYNMMDAKELLKFQELTSIGPDAPGPFSNHNPQFVALLPQVKHAFRENAILNGVNSDWKNVPLQYSNTLNHTLSVSGGDSHFSYNVGLSKGTNTGVMKGSENSNTAAYAILMYRKGKINISNSLNLNGRKQNASPFGSFSEYVKIPSYYRVNHTDRYLEDHLVRYYVRDGQEYIDSYQFANPLYNAHLPYKNSINGFGLTNDLITNWDVLPFLRLSSGFKYGKTNDHSDYFISPLHTKFDDKEANQKGSYDYSSSNIEDYSGFLTLTYNKVFAEKHIINMNMRGEMKHRSIEGQNISAVGFATTSEPLIYLANSYTPDSRPGGSSSKQNSMALIGSLNYSYDMKYNVDLAYNLSGTSNFGSDNPYQSFYSTGLRWNIGRESFLENSKVVNALSLSANFGLTGNQNAGNFGSRSTYVLNNDPSFFGESLSLKGLGNPNLDWTKTYNLSYGLSGIFFKNVLSLSLNGYRNLTDPLIITMPSPPSVGLPDGIPKNAGKLTTSGLELIADARLVNTRDWTFNLGLTSPLFYKSEYSGLGKTLEKFNESARNGGYAQRYFDGASPDDVWAVRSIGIGQARGFEVYLDKNGKYTYVFDKNNEVVIGSSRPKIQGTVNIRARYKRFTLSVYSRYVFQEMKFNNALYNKVENISPAQMEYNQDKRALYLRWQKPGDDASFLGIMNFTQGMSSRFLQKENALYIDGINFNFDLIDQYSEGLKSVIRKKLGLQSITFGVTTANIFQFRLSNIKLERGLDYPFQRTINFNVNLTF